MRLKVKLTCGRLVCQVLRMQVAARWEAHNVGPAGIVDLLPIQGCLALQYSVPKGNAVRPQQVIQRWHIGAACSVGQPVSAWPTGQHKHLRTTEAWSRREASVPEKEALTGIMACLHIP